MISTFTRTRSKFFERFLPQKSVLIWRTCETVMPPFEQIKVIVPTPMIEDNLNRFFADHFGATPGIEFSNVASWMFKVLGQSLQR